MPLSLRLRLPVHRRGAPSRQEDVQALPDRVEGGGVGARLRDNLFVHAQRLAVDDVHHTGVADGNVEAAALRVVPDRVRLAGDRHASLLLPGDPVEYDHSATIAGDEDASGQLVQVKTVGTGNRHHD